MKLQTKILLTIVVISVLVNSLFIYYFISNESKNAHLRLKKKTENISELLDKVNSGPLYDADIQKLETNLKSFLKDPEIYSLSIKEINGDIDIFFDKPELKKTELIYKNSGIFYNGKKIGIASTAYSKAIINKKLSESKKHLILEFIFITLIILISISLLLRKIIKPISKLTELSSEIANGNLDKEIKFSRKDEIGILSQSFFKMQTSIKQKIQSLKTEIEVRKETETELKESKELYQSYLNNAPYGIFVADKNGKYISVNKSACLITGYPEEELLNMSVPDLLGKDGIEAGIKHFERVIKTGKSSGELPLVKKDGSKNYWFIDAIKLSDNRFLGFCSDITEKKKLEEQLNHSQRMDAIGQLAGGVAHDFNNMLGGIMGAAELLKSQNKNLDKKGLKLVEMIFKASTRAADLTAKLLSFGRKGKIASTTIKLHNVIDNTTTILKRTIDKRVSILIIKKAKNDIIIGDGSELENIFINMGINASHAMPDGGKLYIETRNIILNDTYCNSNPFNLEPGEYIDIEVRDTGHGIPIKSINKIFEPFYTTKKQGMGTGLGLSAVYGTVLDHHGEIKVYSEEGIGTSFHILFPCSEKDEKAHTINDKVITGSGHILFVDDEEIIRTTGKLIFEGMGYKTSLAKNGKEGVKLFKKLHNDINLVIMDMVMPEMNGKEAFFKMKEIDKNCKIIISSGFSKSEHLIKLKESGLSGFIRKPFRESEISKLIDKVLKSQ